MVTAQDSFIVPDSAVLVSDLLLLIGGPDVEHVLGVVGGVPPCAVVVVLVESIHNFKP